MFVRMLVGELVWRPNAPCSKTSMSIDGETQERHTHDKAGINKETLYLLRNQTFYSSSAPCFPQC